MNVSTDLPGDMLSFWNIMFIATTHTNFSWGEGVSKVALISWVYGSHTVTYYNGKEQKLYLKTRYVHSHRTLHTNLSNQILLV